MYMKKMVAISLLVFFATIAVIFYRGITQNKTTNQKATVEENISLPKSTKTFSSSEVAAHNSSNNCWIIINDKVYEVTQYLSSHPGGSETIIPYCGQDATRAFETKDMPRPKPHSTYARNLLENFYLGDLKK